jgi:hypothetical protein
MGETQPSSESKLHSRFDVWGLYTRVDERLDGSRERLEFFSECMIAKSLIDDSEQSDRAESAPWTNSSPRVEIDFP